MPIKKCLAKGSWMFLIPILGVVYNYLDCSHGEVYSLVTGLDRITPFVPQFIVPYVSWYAFIFIILVWLLFKDTKLYAITLSSMVFGVLVSYCIYSVFQTTVPRPVVEGQDVFSHLIRLVYNSDKPYNAFPSIHVLTSYIIFLVSFRIKGLSKILIRCSQILSIMIICSTVFLKQHVLLDVLAGVMLGWAAFKLANYTYDKLVVEEVKTWQGRPSLLSMTNMKSRS